MRLPYAEVVAAVRGAGSEAGRLRVDRLATALARVESAAVEQAAAAFVKLVAGSAPDPVASREVALEIASMSAPQRSLACVLAPALATSPEDAAVVGRALVGIAAASGAAIGAVVPLATAIDATLLEACRDAGAQWESAQLAQKKGAQRAEELARRVARALGVKVETQKQVETPEVSAERLAALDLELAAAAARAAEVEKKLRASLPKV